MNKLSVIFSHQVYFLFMRIFHANRLNFWTKNMQLFKSLNSRLIAYFSVVSWSIFFPPKNSQKSCLHSEYLMKIVDNCFILFASYHKWFNLDWIFGQEWYHFLLQLFRTFLQFSVYVRQMERHRQHYERNAGKTSF